jgi:hypothetical protein
MSVYDTLQLIQVRRTWASLDAETTARTRELIAEANTLLHKPIPTTFLGKCHYPPFAAEDQE